MKNTGDNVFDGIPVGSEEGALFARFLDTNDFADNSRRHESPRQRKQAKVGALHGS